MTVRGFIVSDELEGLDAGDTEMAYYESEFRKINDHVHCSVCHGSHWAMTAFVFPRNGFSEFPLDFAPGVVQSRKAV